MLQRHQLGKLHLEVDTASMTSAMQLRARAEELAWRRLPQILEAVFDALAPPGYHVRIDRLDLDLGEIGAAALEDALPAAFERTLRTALTEAIGTALRAPSEPAYALAPAQALLCQFDAYLVSGATTAPRGGAGSFDPAGILLDLIQEQPGALAGVLRRHAHDRYAIERLVLQAGEQALLALLGVLAPAEAAVIAAYLGDMRRTYPQAPAARLKDPALRRALWVLTLKYLLNEAGTQFNRRSYLISLIAGLAMAEGISYAELLASLQAVAAQTRASHALTGSLMGVLDELLRLPHADPPGQAGAGLDDLEHWHDRLRRSAATPLVMDTLVRQVPAKLFARLVARLEPLHAALILAYVAELTSLHRQRPVLNQSAATFGRQLRLLSLRYLLLDAGSQFNRRTWLRRLLLELAASAGVSYRVLLTAFTAALDELRERLPLSSSLPEVLAQLSGELAPDANDPPAFDALLAMAERFLRNGQPLAAGPRLCELAVAHPIRFGTLLRRLLTAASGNAGPLRERLLDWMLPEELAAALLPGQTEQLARWAEVLAEQPGASMASAWEQVLDAALRGQPAGIPDVSAWPAQRLDRLAILRHWLDHGAVPAWAATAIPVENLLAGLAHQTLAVLHKLFGDPDPERIVLRLWRMVDRIGSVCSQAVLERLAPWAFTPGGVLAALEPGLKARALDELRIRCAAAAVAALPLDLEQLARPIPPPPAPAVQQAEPPAASATEQEQLLLAWLNAGPQGAPLPSGTAFRLFADLLGRDSPALDAALRQGLARPECRQRWAAAMPEEILVRLIYRLAPAAARLMTDMQTVMEAAWRQAAPPGSKAQQGVPLWSALLGMLALAVPPQPRAVARQLLACLVENLPAAAERVLSQAQWLARQGGYANLSATLQAQSAKIPPTPPRPTVAQAVAPADGDAIYIANAGLVLVQPFLPMFLKLLGLLSVDHDGVERLLGLENASRAVHLLQFLVDGRCNASEPELALNKLLCGLALEATVTPSIAPSESEQALCKDMLTSVIGRWPAISNTSLEGLRETFLQRDGRLLRREGKWTLTVSRKTVDVLLDQIPWGLATVLHPWMPKELSVKW